LGALLLRGRGGEGRGGEGKRGGKGREGKGLKPPQSKFSGYVAAQSTLHYMSGAAAAQR